MCMHEKFCDQSWNDLEMTKSYFSRFVLSNFILTKIFNLSGLVIFNCQDIKIM